MKKLLYVLLISILCISFSFAEENNTLLPPGGVPEDIRAELLSFLQNKFGETRNATNIIFIDSSTPVVFYSYEEKDSYINGFCWKESNNIYTQKVDSSPVHRVGSGFGNLKNGGDELITFINELKLLGSKDIFVSVHRKDPWYAWYAIFYKKGLKFVEVWSISPWTSVKRAYTESNSFEFKDLDGDGNKEIVNKYVYSNAWDTEPKEEKKEEVYTWDGLRFTLLSPSKDDGK